MKNLVTFNGALKILKYKVELKTYRGVTCHSTEGLFNISRKTDWWFEKLHKEFG